MKMNKTLPDAFPANVEAYRRSVACELLFFYGIRPRKEHDRDIAAGFAERRTPVETAHMLGEPHYIANLQNDLSGIGLPVTLEDRAVAA